MDNTFLSLILTLYAKFLLKKLFDFGENNYNAYYIIVIYLREF